MNPTIQLQLLLATFAGWVRQRQTSVIQYLVEENRVLKEQIESSGRQMRLTDDQRRRLAAKRKPLGRKILQRIATIVTPDTILAWHRRLIAAKWTYARQRVGRPGVMKEIRRLIVEMAEDNPSWGYARIQGALKHLEHRVARSTIAKTLKEHGIKPSPDRPMSWATFVRSHAHLIAQNLTDYEDGFLTGKRFLIIDRDCIFSPAIKSIVASADVEILLTAYQAPNMNAHAERFIRSIKSECIGQSIFVGQSSLEHAIKEFVEHYHDERSHQGIGNRIVSGAEPQSFGRVTSKRRLGGMLNYYHRRAA